MQGKGVVDKLGLIFLYLLLHHAGDVVVRKRGGVVDTERTLGSLLAATTTG